MEKPALELIRRPPNPGYAPQLFLTAVPLSSVNFSGAQGGSAIVLLTNAEVI